MRREERVCGLGGGRRGAQSVGNERTRRRD